MCLPIHTSIYSNLVLFNDSKYMYHVSTDSMPNSQIQSKILVTMSTSFSPLKWDLTIQILNTRVCFISI